MRKNLLYRTYKYELKLNSNQKKVFRSMLKCIYVTYLTVKPELEKDNDISINKLALATRPLFEKYNFSTMFSESIFPQVLTNLKRKSSVLEDAFPITFKNFFYHKDLNLISLPFCKGVRLSHHREINGKTHKSELYYKDNKWYINILISVNKPTPKTNDLTTIGIDVGLKSFAFLSNGREINNPRFYNELQEKISIEQSKLARKQKDSKSWVEQKRKIRRLYSKINNQRQDFLHKLSNYITDNYDVIGIESINIKELQKKKHLRNSLTDASWGEFIEMLRYKSEQKGKHIINVERFYPSSQLCSNCGSRAFMPVHMRTYACSNCKQEIDRDFNASLNIENRAKELYLNRINNYRIT